MSATVAVVGCGRWGSVHLNNLLEMRQEGLIGRVVACDIAVNDTNPFLDSDAQYNTWQAMCEQERLDLIVLATPNDTHYRLGTTFLGKGIKTLIEKPFAPTEVKAARLVELARLNETVVFSGHLLRHHAGVIRIAQLLQAGTIGKPSSVLYRRTTPRAKPNSMNIYDGLASHGVDLLEHFFPSQFDFSQAETPHQLAKTSNAATFSVPTSDSNLKVTMIGRVEVGWAAVQESRDIVIEGDKGVVSLDFGQNESIDLNGKTVHLGPQFNPLRTQILACLNTHQITPTMGSELCFTVKNMELIKTSTTRHS